MYTVWINLSRIPNIQNTSIYAEREITLPFSPVVGLQLMFTLTERINYVLTVKTVGWDIAESGFWVECEGIDPNDDLCEKFPFDFYHRTVDAQRHVLMQRCDHIARGDGHDDDAELYYETAPLVATLQADGWEITVYPEEHITIRDIADGDHADPDEVSETA